MITFVDNVRCLDVVLSLLKLFVYRNINSESNDRAKTGPKKYAVSLIIRVLKGTL